MAASKHPLDLFRSSKSGFDSATRDSKQRRRTMAGKVLVSTPRQAEEGSDAVTAVEAATIDEDEVVDAVDEAEDDDESPANALEAILAQRRALDAKPAVTEAAVDEPAVDEPAVDESGETSDPEEASDELSADASEADAGPAARRRVEVPAKPLRPVGLSPSAEATSAPVVTRPLTQTPQADNGLTLPPGISSGTRSLSYLLLGIAGALVLGLGIFSLFTDGDEGGEIDNGTPPLQNSANAGTDLPLGTNAAPSEYTIQAGHYGTKIDAAYDALDALEARGFTEVNITGIDDGKGGFAEINLIVGRATSKKALEGTLAKLRATSLPNDKLPFYEAYIVGHPESE